MAEIEVKVRLLADYKDWKVIPVSFRTRDLTSEERSRFLVELKDWAQTKFVACVRWNEKGSLNGNYFNHREELCHTLGFIREFI
jgi:hypothetical protein